MVTCNSCGTQLPDDRAFCPQCGEEVFHKRHNRGRADFSHFEVEYDPYPEYSRSADEFHEDIDPAYVYSTPKERMTLGMGDFLGSLLLMMIPVVGIVIQIIWALGGAYNVNRRNLARAMLVLSIIGAAIVIILLVAITPKVLELFEMLESMGLA